MNTPVSSTVDALVVDISVGSVVDASVDTVVYTPVGSFVDASVDTAVNAPGDTVVDAPVRALAISAATFLAFTQDDSVHQHGPTPDHDSSYPLSSPLPDYYPYLLATPTAYPSSPPALPTPTRRPMFASTKVEF
ncbi:MAG: hypothetical protein Q9168_002054 [Polycauliona sp. 1 TL-2023]